MIKCKSTFPVVLMGLVIALTFSQCVYNEIPEPVIELPEDSISFSLDIQPIFEASCITCHKSGSVNPDLTSGNSYTNLIAGSYLNSSDAASSPLVMKIDGSAAGHKEVTAQELALIIGWIEEGAKNN